MEKLISLAQVEQLFKEMKKENKEKAKQIRQDCGIKKGYTNGAIQEYEEQNELLTYMEIKLKARLSSLPTEESGWIAVNTQLPEEHDKIGGVYILAYNGIAVFETRCEDGRFWDTDDSGQILNITHWMPLPKPPLQ